MSKKMNMFIAGGNMVCSLFLANLAISSGGWVYWTLSAANLVSFWLNIREGMKDD